MEDAQRIFDYLPVSYKNPTEKEYVDFLWDAFVTNYQAEKYPFAFLAYHMLFMCFVYFEIWQIRENCYEDFQKAMVGFNKDTEKELLDAQTPFALWQVNESSVFTAHSNGNIFYIHQKSLGAQIDEMLSCLATIQERSAPIIEKAYRNFLINNNNAENREFVDDESQIREVFVHGNYLSLEDVRIAQKWDISVLSGEPGFANIQALAETMKREYPVED